MAWCLPLKEVEKFKRAILSGHIDPERLAEMSSKERRELFARELGDVNAEPVNAQFESKLLLKNRQAGYVNWARTMLGENTPVGRDVISRIRRMDKVLDAADEQVFLEDLAAKRLGTQVSFDEAKRITELSKKIDETKSTMESGGDRLDYGLSLVNLRNYVGDLKTEAQRTTLQDIKKQPIRSVGKAGWTALQTAKAVKAAWDLSAIFRPGIKVMLTHPGVWQRNARQQFKDVWNTYGGRQVMDTVNADILSRENSLNGNYKKGKVDLGITEEAYPTDIPDRVLGYAGEKIEGTTGGVVRKIVGRAVGKTYKASQDAYSAFNTRTRADLFDKYVDIANRSGQEMDTQTLESIGRMTNSLVARGRLGALEPVAQYVNVPFFSPKMLKSHVDVLMEPLSGGGGGFFGQEGGTNFVRKQAALNLLKIIGGTAAILGIAKALKPDSVEFDPRSANAGKIRIGDTRFDVTGGWASVMILASRLATMKTKSSITGKIRSLNERNEEGKLKYGTQTAKDLVYDFFENKYSPPFAVARDLAKGETRAGERPTAFTTLRDLYEPLPSSNYRELKNNPNSAPILLAMIMDGLGIATNTYSAKTAPIFSHAPLNRELQQLDKTVRGTQRDEGETLEQYEKRRVFVNKQIEDDLKALIDTRMYKQLSAEEKKEQITMHLSKVTKQANEDYQLQNGLKKLKDLRQVYIQPSSRPRQIAP